MSKHRNFDQKSKLLPKIGILTENRNFDQKLKFSPKFEILTKNEIVVQKSMIILITLVFYISTLLSTLVITLVSTLVNILVSVLVCALELYVTYGMSKNVFGRSEPS